MGRINVRSKTVWIGLIIATITVLSLQTARAEANFGLFGLGVRAGLVVPNDPIKNTIGLGAQARIGNLTKDVGLNLFMDFWTRGYNQSEIGLPAKQRWTQVAIGGMAKYYIPTQSGLNPFGGAGLSINFSHNSYTLNYVPNPILATSGSTDHTDVGLHLAAGIEPSLNPDWDGLIEAKYSIDGAKYFSLMIGATYKIGAAKTYRNQ